MRPYSLTDKTPARFFLDVMENGGTIPAGLDDKRQSDAEYVFQLMRAMASTTEKQVLLLKPPERDEAHAQRIAQEVVKLVARRIIQLLKVNSDHVSIGQFKETNATINSILEKGKRAHIIADSTVFASWRDPDASSTSQPLMSSQLGKRPATSADLQSPSQSVTSNPRAGRTAPAREVDSSSEESDEQLGSSPASKGDGA